MHCLGVAELPQSASMVQLGLARVSTMQAPALQYMPVLQSASTVQAGAQWPAVQRGASAGQSASTVHDAEPSFTGWQAPFSHVKPSAHGSASQLARHCPSAQTFPTSHSLEYTQATSFDLHVPATQESSLGQSLEVMQ